MTAQTETPKQQLIDEHNANQPHCQKPLGASLTDFDTVLKTATMTFDINTDLCHSGNVVQGGYVAAMLDAVAFYAVKLSTPDLLAMPTLELKVSYLAPSLAGRFTGTAQVIKAGKSIGFLEGRLYNSNEEVTAVLSSTVKIVRQRS